MHDQDGQTEIETLRTQLAHWKAFATHAEGERSAWVLHRRANEGQRAALADEVAAQTVRADADRVMLRHALAALEYHREQTRPTEQTDCAIASLRHHLGIKE
jgi:hypothetical protein